MPRRKRDIPWLAWINGIAYACWYDAGAKRTRRLSLRTTDADEATARYAAFLNEGRDQYKRTATGADLTCGDALDHYVAEHVERDCIDDVRIKSKVKNLKEHFARIPVVSVTIQTSRDYVDKRRAGEIGRKPAGDGTINGELTTLTAALNHEAKWKRLAKSDIPCIDKPAPPEGRERWLTHAELARLFLAVEDDVRLWGFCLLAYYTAARRRSLETLTWFQVDEEARRIRLNPAGRRQTKKRRPIVPIDPALRPVLKRLREAFPKSEYVLGGKSPLWHRFNRAVKRLGIADVTPHTLRHTRATHLLQQGKSPWAVANLLGDTLKTVSDTYGHHCPDYLEETMAQEDDAEDMLQ